jgi:PleD family two-component response regulator
MARPRHRSRTFLVAPRLRVTISSGVAVTQLPDVLTFEEIVSRADQALYRAMETGRTRVEMWTD